MEFSEEPRPRWTQVNLVRLEFQLLKPTEVVSPIPLLIRSESST
jgi:hypothetical protein